jgi:hypothetical protein
MRTVPENWNSVPLEAWARLNKTIGEKPEDLVGRVRLGNKRVAALFNIDIEEAKKLPMELGQQIAHLMAQDMPTKLYKRFKLNGIKYGVITKAHKLPSGETELLVADARILKTKEVIPALNTKGNPDYWHQALFNVCKPLKRKWYKLLGIPFYYKWEPYEFESFEIRDRIEDFKQLPLGIANPIAVFFSRLSKEYYNYTLDYLAKEQETMQKMLKKSEEDLRHVGDGT